MRYVENGVAAIVGRYANKIPSKQLLFQNCIPDILDNTPSLKKLKEYNSTYEDSRAALDRIVPYETRDQFIDAVSTWQVGETHGSLVKIGKQDTNSNHPHLFELTKLEDGVEFVFVDPEKLVGRKNMLRPQISNLLQMKITNGDEKKVELAVVRFKCSDLAGTDIELAAQHQETKDLIENNGIPQVIANNTKAIVFRLCLGREPLIQARYTTNIQAKNFFQGKQSSPMVEGKIHSMHALFQDCLIHLTDDSSTAQKARQSYSSFIDASLRRKKE
jgi:hypothetical protein